MFLFKESVILHECTALNNGMLSEYQMAKDLEGSAHEVILGNIWVFIGD